MSPVLILLVVMLFINVSWKTAFALVGIMILLFVGSIVMRQESMLYVPCVMPGMQIPSDNPEGYRSPADHGLKFEDVDLQTSDGLMIHGWFMPAAEAATAPTVFFCHANAGNIGLRIPNYKELQHQLQVNIFAFDYRGYGKSEGSPHEEGLIEDALTAWRWLSQKADEGKLDKDKIFVFGRSLGGAVAIALAHEVATKGDSSLPQPKGLILENTFASISSLVDSLFPFLAFQSLKERFLRIKWESVERIADLEVPLLFLTGAQDEIVPPTHSRALHHIALKSSHKEQVIFPDGMHNDTWEKGGARYWQAWYSFMRKCGCPTSGSASTRAGEEEKEKVKDEEKEKNASSATKAPEVSNEPPSEETCAPADATAEDLTDTPEVESDKKKD
mmetsp:Transcript_98256/g.204931  ORF Transcript_98256/g.204931 Transcript_98256/m.204931 type:complete len:388 (-) Transcript_98256:118-1281(-)